MHTVNVSSDPKRHQHIVRYNQPSRIFLPEKKKYILNPLNRGPQEFEFCIFDAFSCDHTSSAGQHGCLVKRSKFMFPMQLERHVRIHPWVMMYTNFLHNMTRHWSICFLLPTTNWTCPQLKSNEKQVQTLELISSFLYLRNLGVGPLMSHDVYKLFAQYDPALVDLFPFAYDHLNIPTVIG